MSFLVATEPPFGSPQTHCCVAAGLLGSHAPGQLRGFRSFLPNNFWEVEQVGASNGLAKGASQYKTEDSFCPWRYGETQAMSHDIHSKKNLVAPEQPALTSLSHSNNSYSFHLSGGFQCWFDTKILLFLFLKAQGHIFPFQRQGKLNPRMYTLYTLYCILFRIHFKI